MRAVPYLSLSFVLAAAFASTTFAAQKPETPHLAFVTEYIRQLAAIESIRDVAKQELKEAGESEQISSGIHMDTLFELELQSETITLKSMRLNPPYNGLIADITGIYDFKVTVLKRITAILSTILAGSIGLKPGIDYGALAAEMPQLRARLDYLDKTLFQDCTPLVFSTLIDLKADSKNHTRHLVITKAERAMLVETLDNSFGPKMEPKGQNFGVSAAAVLKHLLSERRGSDEPWE